MCSTRQQFHMLSSSATAFHRIALSGLMVDSCQSASPNIKIGDSNGLHRRGDIAIVCDFDHAAIFQSTNGNIAAGSPIFWETAFHQSTADVDPPGAHVPPSFEKPLSSERLDRQQSSTEPAGREANNASQDADGGIEMATSVEEFPTSEDAIGRQFPLSSSIAATCKRDPDLCKEAHEWLAQMAQEPRDQQWAPRAEESLRETILAEGDKYSIRALECRRTVCAIEVASIHGPLFTLKAEELERYRLWGRTVIMGYETNEYGKKVTVTVWIYERK
jgi:hypothetical protein